MIYRAFLHQDGGCDYTIECGTKLIHITAENKYDAVKALDQIIRENYPYDSEQALSSVEVYEIKEVIPITIEEMYRKHRADDLEKSLSADEVKERFELARLKKKYESNS